MCCPWLMDMGVAQLVVGILSAALAVKTSLHQQKVAWLAFDVSITYIFLYIIDAI